MAIGFHTVLIRECRSMAIRLGGSRRQAFLNLLAVEFSETEAPSGVVLLEFSGGATVRLEVECLEAELADLGSSWMTVHCPAHAEVGDGAPKSKRA